MTVIADDPGWVTSTEVMEATGITYRQLDYWSRDCGILHPVDQHGRPVKGTGIRRYFPAVDLPKIRVLVALASLDLVRSVAASDPAGPWIVEHDGTRITIEVTA